MCGPGVRSGVRHRQNAGRIVAQRFVDFIGKTVTGTAGPRPVRTASLNNESGNNPVKSQSVKERFSVARRIFNGSLRQTDKVGDRHRRLFEFQFNRYGAPFGFDNGIKTFSLNHFASALN